MPALDRITRNPDVMGGKPCVRGMRVTVGTWWGWSRQVTRPLKSWLLIRILRKKTSGRLLHIPRGAWKRSRYRCRLREVPGGYEPEAPCRDDPVSYCR